MLTMRPNLARQKRGQARKGRLGSRPWLRIEAKCRLGSRPWPRIEAKSRLGSRPWLRIEAKGRPGSRPWLRIEAKGRPGSRPWLRIEAKGRYVCAKNLAHLVALCSHGCMRKHSWTWFLQFAQWLACLALVTSLWGCAAPYEIVPSSSLPTSYLPTSAQFEADTERLALPPELRERLQKAVAEEACRARPDPRLMGQVVNDPRARAQMRLVKETLAWISEVAKDPEPSPQRLEHRQKLRFSIPGASTAEEPTTEAPTAETEPSLLGEDGTEYTKGFVYGATSGAVPLAPQAIDIAIEVRALPKGKYWARFGRACGQIAIGTGQMILAGAGMGAGMGMCGSGGGAPAGYVVFAGSMALGANGYVTAWHGFEDLKQLRREGEPCDAPLTEKPVQQQAPTQQAAPAKPTETPAKPNSQSTTPAVSERGPPTPVETRTTTYDRTTGVTTSRTESGTTTVTKPRQKQAPVPKDKAGPPANGGVAKPHGGTAHDAAIDTEIARLQQDPAVTNIRKNQQQVDINGNKVGTNRPDIQFDKNGRHHCIEFDMNPSNGGRHETVIQKNDPNAQVQLRIP